MIDLINAMLQGAANSVIVVAGLVYLADQARARAVRRSQLSALQSQAHARAPASANMGGDYRRDPGPRQQ